MAVPDTAIQKVNDYMHSDEVQLAFSQAIGDRNAGAYILSVMLAIKNDDSGKLALCTPQSIYTSALRAATLRLSVDPSTGQAYLVSYKDKATLIVGYKGLYDMAVRTGRYRYINVTERYEGQTTEADPISGLITLAGLGGKKISNKVIGWLAAFEMNPERGQVLGYAHTIYMTVEEIHAYAEKNSRGYNYKNSAGEFTSLWHKRPAAMERKQVLRILLRQYGYMDPSDSAALKQAETEAGDEAVIDAEFNNAEGAPESEDIPGNSVPSPEELAAAEKAKAEADLSAALALWGTIDGKKVQFSELTSPQLQYIATNSKVTDRIEAALLILELKFQMPRPGASE